MDELMNFELHESRNTSLIKVLGVGGGGSNAVNHMFRLGIKDVGFIVCNTDAQALENSPVPEKIHLGQSVTEGRGAGNKPQVGKQAAIESREKIINILSENTKMLFITVGMGGGTGTGAAPVIAAEAKELGILTVAIVTIPFKNEGPVRIKQALEGITELEKHVDSLLIINNEKIREIYGNLKVSQAFSKADDVLAVAAKGIAEIITVHGFINVDFADVQTVMTSSGVAILGTGTAEGEERAIEAIQQALTSPLLNDTDIKGAKNLLLNIISGADEVTMDEIGQIIDYVKECSGAHANLIWGNGTDENLGKEISVTVIATGFKAINIPQLFTYRNEVEKIELSVNDGEKHPDDIFIIKDDPLRHVEIADSDQRTIEFDLQQEGGERLSHIKRIHEEIREIKQSQRQSDKEIEELENTPAYKRKKIQIETKKYSDETKVSKSSLSDDDDLELRFDNENSYFDPMVD